MIQVSAIHTAKFAWDVGSAQLDRSGETYRNWASREPNNAKGNGEPRTRASPVRRHGGNPWHWQPALTLPSPQQQRRPRLTRKNGPVGLGAAALGPVPNRASRPHVRGRRR
jgi:hypothetical protein